MKVQTVRKCRIGEGKTKICTPIIGRTKKEILTEAINIKELPIDLVEWRVDFYENIFDSDMTLETLISLRETLEDIPLLFTFRTANEGGEQSVNPDTYMEINLHAAKSGKVDLIDLEYCIDESKALNNISLIQQHNIPVITSNHNFHETPNKEDILSRLSTMEKAGANIAKIAVMPNAQQDVLNLMQATLEATEKMNIPIITMSMGQLGMLSRTSGSLTGSAVTFGAAQKASAPGQIGVKQLKNILDTIEP